MEKSYGTKEVLPKLSPKERYRALHTGEAFNGLFDFSIASKAPSGEILLQSQKQMKVTWCEIKTGGIQPELQYGFTLPSRSLVSHCHPTTERQI
ncbi:hypothetical protein TNCV_450521 [Trichonephila clavipes]|nr:hypothetical protein TNCV_450521 [Trichonephila clavipes]